MSLAVPLSLVAVLAAVLVALVVALRRTSARAAAFEARCEAVAARAAAARRTLADLEALPVLAALPAPDPALPLESGLAEGARPERARPAETPDRGTLPDGRRTARRPPVSRPPRPASDALPPARP